MTPCEEWSLDTRRLGCRVLVFDRLASTNDEAARLADDPAHDGVAVLADEQTAGRGQHGRTWLAAPRQSVLLSLALSPPPELRRPVVLTAWAAVAVCGTVAELVGERPAIKWPNDVQLGGRKVCGILIESARKAMVVGIGLNVRQSAEALAAAGLPEATSLAHFGAAPETRAVAVALLRQLDRDYDRLCGGDLATLEAAWRDHLGLLGRPVAAECPDTTHHGRLVALSFGGAELVRPGSAPLRLAPERIRHLTAVD